MAHPLIVFGVACLHYVLRCTAFIEPLPTQHRKIFAGEPTWPACAVLLSICMLLIDADPNWYAYRCRLGRCARTCVDVWATMVAIEFAMITIWSRLELLLSVMVWRSLHDRETFIMEWTDQNVDLVAALLIGFVAAAVLLNAARVTDSWRKVSDLTCEMNESFATWCAERRCKRRSEEKQQCQQMQLQAGDGSGACPTPAPRCVPLVAEPQCAASPCAEPAAPCASSPSSSYREQHPSRSRNKKKICLMCTDCQ